MTLIKHLVFSGGGPNILVTLGAVQKLEKENFWNIKNIKTIYSTSAGCILSVLISLKLNWDDINTYIIERPWNAIFNVSTINLLEIYDEKGLFNKKIFEIFFKPFFEMKDMSLSITLKDFYENTNINLFFFTFELNDFETIKLNHITHPNLKLIDAVYMSSTIPLIFQPICIDEKCYIDGGLIVNYPLNYCLNDGRQENEILSFKNNCVNKINKIIDEKTQAIEYTLIFLNKLINNINTENKQVKIKNEVLCDTNELLSLTFISDFINSEIFREKLIENGTKMAETFLDNSKN